MSMIDDKRGNAAKQNTVHPDEVAIASIEPARPGAGLLHTGAMDRVLIARVKGEPGYASGYDITWELRLRRFRVDHFSNDKPNGTRFVPEGRVNVYTVAAPAEAGR